MYICMHKVYACLHIFNVYLRLYMRVEDVYIHICMDVYIHICIYVYTYLCLNVYIHISMHVRVYCRCDLAIAASPSSLCL